MSAMMACPWPLYVNMLMKDAITWRSSLDVTQLDLPDSVEAAVNQLLDIVEQRLGFVFVSHTLAFITVTNNGLCEVWSRLAVSEAPSVCQRCGYCHIDNRFPKTKQPSDQ